MFQLGFASLISVLILIGCSSAPKIAEQDIQSPDPLSEEEIAEHQGTKLPPKTVSGTIDDYYWQVRSRLASYDRKKYPAANKSSYLWGYASSQKQSGNRWTQHNLLLFTDGSGKVVQVALESYDCGIDDSLESQNITRENFEKLVAAEAPELFKQAVDIDDGDYKSLGPYKPRQIWVDLKNQVSGIKRIRLKRGMYKCDGKGGHGYRLDFFPE